MRRESMSETFKFTVSDENAEQLRARAEEAKLSIQDYIRKQLFSDQIPFTPLEAVNKALTKFQSGDFFTVPQLLDAEWDLPRGMAGQFGRKFFELVNREFNDKIEFTSTFNSKKHAIYRIK